MNDYRYAGQELDVFSRAVNWKKYYKTFLSPYLGDVVAEVGAGIGATTAVLCDGSQKKWLCIEPDKHLCQQIVDRIRQGSLPSICSCSCDLISAFDPLGCFDTVLYIDVLEHILDDEQEMGLAAQRLVPGGTIVVLAPACPFLFSEFDRSIGHYRRYDRQALVSLTPPDCRVEKVLFLDSIGILPSLFNRFLLKRANPSVRQILLWDRVLVPLSRWFDRLSGYRYGRSILVIWRKGPQ